jgi:hypothetical protein
MNYREYMQSPEWRALRAEALERAKYRCEFCGGKAVTAHHVRYPRGGYDKDNVGNLVACCWPCQEKSHGIRKQRYGDCDIIVDTILIKHGISNTAARNELCELVEALAAAIDATSGEGMDHA